MKNTTVMIDDEVFESTNEFGHSLIVDTRDPEQRQHQSPPEMLLSALAGCGAVDIISMLRKRRKNIVKFEIMTEGKRRDETPRAFTALHCHYILTSSDATEDELMKLAKLSIEKYCTVASSMNSEVKVSVRVIKP